MALTRLRTAVCAVVAAGCLGAIAAVSWHSVAEIHYLKTFYPARFTVEEACWAAGVEVLKVALIAFPLLLVLGIALWLGWGCNRRGGDNP